MKLLIINERVDENDAVLGIYAEWINEFARQLDEVNVITQWKGQAKLRKNLHVFSLGKEKGLRRDVQLKRLYKYLMMLVPKVDAILVHMSPVWVLLGAPVFKLYRKPVFLWYAHKHVDPKLKLASKITTNVFSSVPGSIKLKSKKIRLVGQGIPLHKFPFKMSDRGLPKTLRMVTIGRLTDRKDYLTIIKTCASLKKKGIKFDLRIIGPALTAKEATYAKLMKKEIKKHNLHKSIHMVGPIPNKLIYKEYHKADILVNAAAKTGADKVVFEAASTGCLPVTCDPALQKFVGDKRLSFSPGNHVELEKTLVNLAKISVSARQSIRRKMRAKMDKEHNSKVQIRRLISHMKKALK